MDKQREMSFLKNRSNNQVMSYLNERPPIKYLIGVGVASAAAQCVFGHNLILNIGTVVGILAASYAVQEVYNPRMDVKKSVILLAAGVAGLVVSGFVPVVGPLVAFAANTSLVSGISGLVSPYLSKLFRR